LIALLSLQQAVESASDAQVPGHDACAKAVAIDIDFSPDHNVFVGVPYEAGTVTNTQSAELDPSRAADRNRMISPSVPSRADRSRLYRWR
jgi:hypothetical protein